MPDYSLFYEDPDIWILDEEPFRNSRRNGPGRIRLYPYSGPQISDRATRGIRAAEKLRIIRLWSMERTIHGEEEKTT